MLPAVHAALCAPCSACCRIGLHDSGFAAPGAAHSCGCILPCLHPARQSVCLWRRPWIAGDAWRETWRETIAFDEANAQPMVERTAHKWAKAAKVPRLGP